VNLLLRGLALSCCALLAAVWSWGAVAALAVPFDLPAAVLVVVLLVLSRNFRALQLSVLIGAVWIWHLPVLVAILLAAPRLVLILPGLISTYLASRRHPRLRWS
jgi:hypothetical protein